MGKRLPKAEIGKESDKLDPDNSGSDFEAITDPILPEETVAADEFADFFGDGEETDLKVELYRTNPVYANGEQISGFVTRLNPGTDIEWIKNNYGGGSYIVKKRISGRFVNQRAIRIAGPPKLESPPPATAAPAVSTGAPDVRINTPIGEIPIGGSLKDFEAMVTRLAIIRAAFPPTPDINAVLLQHALDKGSGKMDLASQIETLTAIRELGESFSGKGGDQPTDLVGLVGKGLDAFGKLIEARTALPKALPGRTVRREPLPAPKRPEISQLASPEGITDSENGPAEVIENNETAAPDAAQEPKPMGAKEMASVAIANIVAAYFEDPPMTVTETVDLLNFVLPPITPVVKEQIRAFKSVLKNAAGIQFSQMDPDAGPEEKQKFLLHFNNVFDTFTA